MNKPLPIVDRLRECFSYDKETGVLKWRIRLGSRAMPGTRAGYANSASYRKVKFDGSLYVEHRLIWKLVTGRDPVEEIDHDNLDKRDNTWRNLREATSSQNKMNTARRDGKSGIKGVGYEARRNRWRAKIVVYGRQIHLGFYRTVDEAREAYARGAEKYFGIFARAA